MKKAILFVVVIFCLSVYDTSATVSIYEASKDTVPEKSGNPYELHCIGADVYLGSSMLSPSKINKILSYDQKLCYQYNKGYSLRETGGLLLLGGVLADIGGIILMVSGIETSTDHYGNPSPIPTYNENYYYGILACTLGEVMITGGIVCKVIGKNKIRGAIYKHNQSPVGTFNQPSLKYDFGFQKYGVGIKLTF